MTSTIRKVLAAAIASAFLVSAPALAQSSPTMDGLAAACEANPGFFDFKIQNLAGDPERHTALCGCLVTAFGEYPEADLVMLTKDLDGSATTEDRTAYGDYTALEARALVALDACVAETGGGTAPAVGNADMTKFDAACIGGPVMIDVMEKDAAKRDAMCACLSTELGKRITTADADVLAVDLSGEATEEQHAGIENYDALSELAGGVLDQCFAGL